MAERLERQNCNLGAPSSIPARTASVAEWLERGHEFNPRPNYSPGFVLGSSELNSSFAIVNANWFASGQSGFFTFLCLFQLFVSAVNVGHNALPIGSPVIVLPL